MRRDSERLVIVSGCSGGGKSTLIEALAHRGFATIPEPGRRIVAEEWDAQGSALPWLDPLAFARRLVDVARADLEAARGRPGLVFFDRGLIDAAAALEHTDQVPVEQSLRATDRFHPNVFLSPPWPEIYAEDPERRHGLAEAVAEYERLLDLYPRLGYRTVILPKASVEDRVGFVLAALGYTPETRRAPGFRQTPSERP